MRDTSCAFFRDIPMVGKGTGGDGVEKTGW